MTAATRRAVVTPLWVIVIFTLLAAIWFVSWQWAATGGLLLLVAATFSGLAMQDRERKLPPQTATITTERVRKRESGCDEK